MEDENILQIGITSDIDDFPDYLEIDEYVAIISTIITKCINRILGADEEDYFPENFDENDEEQCEKLDKSHDFTEALVHLVVNIINNTERQAFNLNQEEIECSLITYGNEEDGTHVPRETYHSNNISAFDPLQAIYPLICDTMYCLVDNGMEKHKVKAIMSKSLDMLKLDLDKILEKM